MSGLYRGLFRPWLFRSDPEEVHERVMDWTRRVFAVPPVRWACQAVTRVQDPVSLMGLTFPNRVGLAAGFDKNGHFIQAASGLGFGHLEVGAVTPRPQPGQDRPRLFRVAPESLRNHMGFNNDGVDAVLPRLQPSRDVVLGLNLGKGKDTPLEQAAQDYISVMEVTWPWVDYFSVNISSPNTQGLRQLGQGGLLRDLCRDLTRTARTLADLHQTPERPVLLKISPDQNDEDLEQLVEVSGEAGLRGYVACNTTVRREGSFAHEPAAGGLSGLAVRDRALRVVTRLRQLAGSRAVILGVGGIDSPDTARAMRAAGADLVQVYTGFVYQGPGLPRRIARALAAP